MRKGELGRPPGRRENRHRVRYAVRIRVQVEERNAWHGAAPRHGLTLQAWAARVPETLPPRKAAIGILVNPVHADVNAPARAPGRLERKSARV